MKKKVIYLCGPIAGCSDAEASDWREYVKQTDLFETLDPMRRDYRGRETEATREIVDLDKLDVRQADALLVYAPKPSVGTSMEILYAWEREKPVVIVVPPGAPVSPWLIYHSTKITDTFGEALRFLREAF